MKSASGTTREHAYADCCPCADCRQSREVIDMMARNTVTRLSSLDAARIRRIECIGFEQGCGCATCLAIDRQHQAIIARGRPHP